MPARVCLPRSCPCESHDGRRDTTRRVAIRGARTLVAGACSSAAQRLVEAFLALGAHVVAADALRTRLEELRARLRQHERLWVAESDLGGLAQAHALFQDVGRDAAIDAAVLVIGADSGLDVCAGDR